MAKKVTQKEVCDACGADVREGSMFCYNCGGPLTAEARAAAEAKSTRDAVSDAWFKGEIVKKEGRRETTKLKPTSTVVEPIAAEPEPKSEEAAEPVAVSEPAAEKAIPKPGIHEEAKLKTAASLRRKGKLIERRTVEVVWEEPASSPGARFILGALLMTLLVVLIFLAAGYLK